MKIFFAVRNTRGLDSEVHDHFGSAPAFVVVDNETDEFETLVNDNQVHAHGKCNPVGALQGRKIDAVVTGGIGRGALGKLGTIGVDVYRAQGGSVRDNLEMLREGNLGLFGPEMMCSGRGWGGGCSHK